MKRRVARVAAAALIVAMLGAAGAAARLRMQDGDGGPPRAAIVDQLGASSPNPVFVQEARAMLEEAGYVVDYYPPEQVTVDLYRQMGTHGYDFIVLRSHSSERSYSFAPDGTPTLRDQVRLFTNEPYDVKLYTDDQRAARLTIGTYPERDRSERWFSIDSQYIEEKMRGDLDGALVLLMGCGGLFKDNMARAFAKKGADTFISWDASVTAGHTDASTERLMAYLLRDKMTPEDAIASTTAELGPDPIYGARLAVFRAD